MISWPGQGRAHGKMVIITESRKRKVKSVLCLVPYLRISFYEIIIPKLNFNKLTLIITSGSFIRLNKSVENPVCPLVKLSRNIALINKKIISEWHGSCTVGEGGDGDCESQQ